METYWSPFICPWYRIVTDRQKCQPSPHHTFFSFPLRTPPVVSSYSTPSVPQTTQHIRNTKSLDQEVTDEMWQRELAELFSPSAEEGATSSARTVSCEHYVLYAILTVTALLSLLVNYRS